MVALLAVDASREKTNQRSRGILFVRLGSQYLQHLRMFDHTICSAFCSMLFLDFHTSMDTDMLLVRPQNVQAAVTTSPATLEASTSALSEQTSEPCTSSSFPICALLAVLAP
jgi:hypothetical protein